MLYKQQLKGDVTDCKHWRRVSELDRAEEWAWSGPGPKVAALLVRNFIDIVNVNNVRILHDIQRCVLENNNYAALSLQIT